MAIKLFSCFALVQIVFVVLASHILACDDDQCPLSYEFLLEKGDSFLQTARDYAQSELPNPDSGTPFVEQELDMDVVGGSAEDLKVQVTLNQTELSFHNAGKTEGATFSVVLTGADPASAEGSQEVPGASVQSHLSVSMSG